MPLPKNCCSTSLFTTRYKRLSEEGQEVFMMGFFLAETKLMEGGLLKGELLKG
jgi:hypothetical protein